MKQNEYNINLVFNALDYHCRIKGQYGFTIPYLIKICANIEHDFSVKNFLLTLSKDQNTYFITYCSELEEIIIGFHKPREYAPLHMYLRFENLYYDDTKIGSFENFNALVDQFERKYSPIIEQGKFSKNPDTLCWE